MFDFIKPDQIMLLSTKIKTYLTQFRMIYWTGDLIILVVNKNWVI